MKKLTLKRAIEVAEQLDRVISRIELFEKCLNPNTEAHIEVYGRNRGTISDSPSIGGESPYVLGWGSGMNSEGLRLLRFTREDDNRAQEAYIPEMLNAMLQEGIKHLYAEKERLEAVFAGVTDESLQAEQDEFDAAAKRDLDDEAAKLKAEALHDAYNELIGAGWDTEAVAYAIYTKLAKAPQKQENKVTEIFSKLECIFQYCPHSEECKEGGCLAPAKDRTEPVHIAPAVEGGSISTTESGTTTLSDRREDNDA